MPCTSDEREIVIARLQVAECTGLFDMKERDKRYSVSPHSFELDQNANVGSKSNACCLFCCCCCDGRSALLLDWLIVV